VQAIVYSFAIEVQNLGDQVSTSDVVTIMHINCNVAPVSIKSGFEPIKLEYDHDTEVKLYEYELS
jgi:hypothetical protein